MHWQVESRPEPVDAPSPPSGPSIQPWTNKFIAQLVLCHQSQEAFVAAGIYIINKNLVHLVHVEVVDVDVK